MRGGCRRAGCAASFGRRNGQVSARGEPMRRREFITLVARRDSNMAVRCDGEPASPVFGAAKASAAKLATSRAYVQLVHRSFDTLDLKEAKALVEQLTE